MNAPLNFLRGSGIALGWLAVCSIFFPSALRAEVLASYTAPENPAGSGSPWAASGRSSQGSPTDSGESAWRIAPEKGNALNYFLREPETLLIEAFEKGWRYSARVRLDHTAHPVVDRNVVTLGVENPQAREAFVLGVRTNKDNGELILEVNKKTIALPGVAADAFHEYAMTYDPVSKTVQIAVDGEVVAPDVSAVPTDRWFLRWGHSSITARGAAEWAWVKFESPVKS